MKSKGTVILAAALIAVALLWMSGLAGAGPTAAPKRADAMPTIVSYQGRVVVNGLHYEGDGYFKFAVVDGAGATSYWSNDGTSAGGKEPTNGVPLSVSAGLFNVLLGDPSLTNMSEALDASVFGGADRYLRVWFSADNINFQMLSPDRRIAAVPYAMAAIEADTVDGEHADAFADASHTHAPADVTPQGEGSGLDADTVDGEHADAFADASHTHAPADVTPQGEGSGLDADTLDGLHAKEVVPPGTIIAYAGATPPAGWLLCDGAAVSRSTYADLYAAIGNAHGQGDGSTTFNLPDYRGYFLRGVDDGQGRDPNATQRTAPKAGANTGDAVGSVQMDQLQSHKHIDYGHTHGYTSQTHYDSDTTERNGSHAAQDSWSSYNTTNGYANLGDPAQSSAGYVRHGAETRPLNAYVLWLIKH